MRTRKKSQPIEKTCIDCGETFIAFAGKALRCEVCRKKKMKEQQKNYVRRLKEKDKPQMPRRTVPKMSIPEVIRATMKYNEEHQTYISEGQYVAMLEMGCK